ncbi:phosphatase PAP2 family protein [Geomonas oryzisoli]|uniref:phosphatase PAP2 family protein n=1 Tax=Geomonas oryzisoli TaxID=2847992 RepID=UPI001EEF9320|nr:phosphatase PAP2 family protein [Geomonas oryzisoli]
MFAGFPVVFLLWLVLCQVAIVTPVHAAENVFTSTTAIKEETVRFAGEGTLFLKGPVDPYLTGTVVTAGLFGLTYLFDEKIRDEFAGSHHGVMRGVTDAGNAVSNPLLHLGVAAAFYGTGALTDQVKVMQLGEEMGEALLLADGATFVLKGVIGRGRPYQVDSSTSYRPFQFKDGYDSLPSMHTASSFALAHVFADKTDNFYGKAACYAAAGLAGFSRVYQNKHWASDVVLGAAIGELAGAAVTRYRSAPAGSVTVAPMAIGGAPAVALLGKF